MDRFDSAEKIVLDSYEIGIRYDGLGGKYLYGYRSISYHNTISRAYRIISYMSHRLLMDSHGK